MEEARYSFNVKVLVNGYECCFTLRDDQPGKAAELVDKGLQVVNYLASKGAQPIKPGAAVRPAAAAPQVPPAPAAPAVAEAAVVAQVARKGVSADPPVCKSCRSSASMELIEFARDGQLKRAWKCQACEKWSR